MKLGCDPASHELGRHHMKLGCDPASHELGSASHEAWV